MRRKRCIENPAGRDTGGEFTDYSISPSRAELTTCCSGFLPCFLRAFPANAMALVAFEAAMKALP
jgi:hypothetical protein